MQRIESDHVQMRHKSKKTLFLFLVSMFTALVVGFGQKPAGVPVTPRSSSGNHINIIWADEFTYYSEGADTLQKLVGNVELRQDTVYLYCDSAIIKNNVTVTASGRFVLQHGRSLSMFADSAIYQGNMKIANLKGNVSLIKGKQKLFTDSLSYDTNTKIATYLNGANLFDDTTRIQSKRGYFHAKTDDIFLSEKVTVTNKAFSMKSDTLKFNANSKVVTFLAPTLINQDSAQIYTEAGFYDISNKRADLYKNPQYVKGTKKAWANFIRYNGKENEFVLIGSAYVEDTSSVAFATMIRFNEKTEVTILSGSAYIKDNERTIIGDSVVYDARKATYSTRGRTRIVDGAQILEADQVDYDNETELGSAKGRVIWQDTTERIIIRCDFVEHSKATNYLKAVGGFDTAMVMIDSQLVPQPKGRPLLIKLMETDSLFISADTLLSFNPKDLKVNIQSDSSLSDTAKVITSKLPDSLAISSNLVSDTSGVTTDTGGNYRIILAYYGVRIFKSDLQAVCDSLSYSNVDSMFRLYKKPIIWADKSQFTAGAIDMVLAENRIDKVFMKNESFIVTTPDEILFNQIKGRNSTAFFENGKVNRVRVEGNSQSVYYPQDDEKRYMGVNKTECSEMSIDFKDNDVIGIHFYAQPKAILSPMKSANHDELRLPGFSWKSQLRPQSINDLIYFVKPKSTESGIPAPTVEPVKPIEK